MRKKIIIKKKKLKKKSGKKTKNKKDKEKETEEKIIIKKKVKKRPFIYKEKIDNSQEEEFYNKANALAKMVKSQDAKNKNKKN